MDPHSPLRTLYRILNVEEKTVTHDIESTKWNAGKTEGGWATFLVLQLHKPENRLGGAYKTLLCITISYRLICAGLWLGLGRGRNRRRRGRARNILRRGLFVDVLVSGS